MSWLRNRRGQDCPRCGRGKAGHRGGKCKWTHAEAEGYWLVLCIDDPEADDEQRGIKFTGVPNGMPGGKYLVPTDGVAPPPPRSDEHRARTSGDLQQFTEAEAEAFFAFYLRLLEDKAHGWRTFAGEYVAKKGARYLPSEYVALPTPSERRDVLDFLRHACAEGGPLASIQQSASDVLARQMRLPASARFLELHRGPDGAVRSARVSTDGTGSKALGVVGVRPRAHYALDWKQHATESGVLVLTEGARKANEVQWRTGYGAVGFASVYAASDDLDELRGVIEELAGRGLREVHLAPDYGDARDGEERHDGTRRAMLGWAALRSDCESCGVSVRGIAWEETRAKGIDDILAVAQHTEGGYPPAVCPVDLDSWIASFKWSSSDAQHLAGDPVDVRPSRRLRPSATPNTSEPVATRESVTAALLDAVRADSGPGVLVFGAPVGAGKTRTLVELSLERADLAIFFRNYAAAREFLNRRKWAARGRGIEDPRPFEVRMGLARGCKRPEVAKLKIEADIGSLCGKCELRGVCPATRKLGGKVLISVHDSFEKLQRSGVLHGRVVIFDENFEPLSTRLPRGRAEVGAWSQRGRSLSRAVSAR